MTIVFDEVQAIVEPPQPVGQPEPPSASTAKTQQRPPSELDQQLRFLHERKARLRAD